ncbi:MAG TPA: sigma 54-interacting transcriptional regulator [Blastocatellia bacterium]|nr:sigma 54-interacting transcriptional regulator [Blastocatellia bacterium]
MTTSKARPYGDVSDRLEAVFTAIDRGERDGALALLGDPTLTTDERAALRGAIGESLEMAGKFDEALSILVEYEDPNAHSYLSSETSARLWLQLASLYRWVNEVPRSITFANHSLRAAGTDYSRGRAHRILGYVYWMLDEYAISRDHLMQALECHATDGDPHELASTYWNLAMVDNVEGRPEAARQDCLKGFELLKGTSSLKPRDHLLMGRLLNNMALINTDRGDVHRSIADYEKSIEHWSFVEDRRFLALAYNNLGDALLAVGEWKRAEAALLTSLQYIRQSSSKRSESTVLLTLADLQLYQGKIDQAMETAMRAFTLARERNLKSAEADCWLTLGYIHHAAGRPADSMVCFNTCLELEERMGRMVTLPETLIALSELALAMGERDTAGEHLRRAVKILIEQPNLYHSGLLARAEGRLRAGLGEFTEAISALAQSISIFESTSYVYQAALSHLEMGRVLARTANKVRASSHLKRALRTFSELHAERARLEAEEVLAATRQSGTLSTVLPSVFTLDALIIERLVAATSSHELLLRELATIIRDETSQTAVLFEVMNDNDLKLITARGCDREYAYEAAREAVRYLTEHQLPESGAKVKFLTDRREHAPRRFMLYTTADASSAIGHLDSLLKLVEQGLEVCTLRATAALGKQPAQRVATEMYDSPLGIVAASAAMRSVIDQIRRIRSSDVTVLITGESGVGKELVARAIHHESARRSKIFLPFNCAAVPDDLMESRLFGHRKGAFTGATSDRVGVARATEGGSLFLDEIGEIALEVQPKLLRFLQEHEIQPLGEDRPITVDVRVIAATNRNLEEFVAERRFREDLYYRLNVIRVNVPPLRERREDIRILAERFLKEVLQREGRQAVLANEAAERLESYAWPGNVRQLRNEIERAVAMVEEGGMILAEHFSPEIGRAEAVAKPSGETVDPSILVALDQLNLEVATAAVERVFVTRALARNGGNITHAAKALGLSRQGLLLKKKRLNIE